MRVDRVEEGSAGELAGVRTGDLLVAVDGLPARDSLDVAYALGWADDDSETVEFEFRRGGERMTVALPNARPEQLGIMLEDDEYRTCPNRCVFCFVDQLPEGLRESLSVKDEDYRLSFAFGNYITLTNVSEDDYDRIAEQHLSPLYVSVHATDDGVRRRMLGNPKAPPILESLNRLAESRIAVHAQVVIVPGMNDGAVFRRTLDDLMSIRAVASVAVVPVGLTSHRTGLADVEPVSPELASELLDEIGRRQDSLREERGSSVIFAVDELYLRAGRELPPYEHYEDFPQLENGVGLLRSFEHELHERLPELEGKVDKRLALAIVTARSAAPFLENVVPGALAGAGPIETRVIPADNGLLGPTVTVAGLLSGADMLRALDGSEPADLVLLPGEAFNADGRTIDGMTVDDIAVLSGRRNVAAAMDLISAIEQHLEDTREP